MRKDIAVNLDENMDATPIAHLVSIANEYRSRIYFEVGENKRVNAKSIMGMMSLLLTPGTVVTVDAEGEDESEAAEALESFLSGKTKL